MLIMTSIIRVGQSKFVTVQIDEDSNERIMNCIQTLSGLETEPAVHDIFLEDTKTAFTRMLGAQEKRAAEKKEAETTKAIAIQVDDLLSFRQFSKKTADEAIDVSRFSLLVYLLDAEPPQSFFDHSTTKMSAGLPELAKFKKISCQILVASRS